jgi:hypothetical protein
MRKTFDFFFEVEAAAGVSELASDEENKPMVVVTCELVTVVGWLLVASVVVSLH